MKPKKRAVRQRLGDVLGASWSPILRGVGFSVGAMGYSALRRAQHLSGPIAMSARSEFVLMSAVIF